MDVAVAEQVIILDALNGDLAAVDAAVAGMLPAERQAFRIALSKVVIALGQDCATCGGIVQLREGVSIGPIGGPYLNYHQGHEPGCERRS
jgi:hypothetical protein